MSLGVELMPKRRLKDINVFEVSFVDKAANGQKFLVFKRRTTVPVVSVGNENFRSDMGGDHIMDIETNDVAGNDKIDTQNAARLAELSEMLDVGNENFRSDVVTKQGEEKIKEDDDTCAGNEDFPSVGRLTVPVDHANTDEDSRYVELRKEIEGLRSMLDELRAGLPIRKGLQETEEPRSRKAGKDKLLSVMKSRELKAKMTCAHAPNPTQWAKELLQEKD